MPPGIGMRTRFRSTWVPETRPILPEVERLIDEAWAEATARPGVHLFDGPMCRMESWQAFPGRLSLVLSGTSYKPFLGTNLMHPELADKYGHAVLANPVGVSPALLTADGWLMMGRRNASVAYYPNRVHPFAGCWSRGTGWICSARCGGSFGRSCRLPRWISRRFGCTGIAEDTALRQPELVFRVTSTRTKAQIDQTLDLTEHHATWSIPGTHGGVEGALATCRNSRR